MARRKRTLKDRKHYKKQRSERWYRGCDQKPSGVKKAASPIPAYYRTRAWRQLRTSVLERDQHICQYCGAKALQADHIMPRKSGGPDAYHNLVACCAPCNRVAGGRIFKTFDEKKWWLLVRRKSIRKELIPATPSI